MSEPDEGSPDQTAPRPPKASHPGAEADSRAGGFGFGVVAFVSGLLGLVLIWTVLATVVLSPLAAVLGCIGIAKGRRSGAGIGLAAAGLTLGLVAVALLGVLWWGLAHETGG